MSTYQYYRAFCSICGAEYQKRDMNKIFVSYSHTSVSSPKVVCSVCDDCLTSFFDNLGVAKPEREVHRGKPYGYCKNCYRTINKTALYCPYCGEKIKRSDNNVNKKDS